MSSSIDITLSSVVAPSFPMSCIVCEAVPDSSVRVSSNSTNPLVSLVAPVLSIFGSKKTEVPICECCKSRYRRQYWVRELLGLVGVLVTVTIAFFWFEETGSWQKKLIMLGAGILGYIPALWLEITKPRYVSILASSRTVCYEFASQSYAMKFEKMNKLSVVSSDLEEGITPLQYKCFTMKRDLNELVCKGTRGVILEEHELGKVFEVEFVDADGANIGGCSYVVTIDDIEWQ